MNERKNKVANNRDKLIAKVEAKVADFDITGAVSLCNLCICACVKKHFESCFENRLQKLCKIYENSQNCKFVSIAVEAMGSWSTRAKDFLFTLGNFT